ncbi:uncharacterized protein LOC133348844 isoform X1 [Lethenteron reissneri]|uniref:uncharacterized protein LOC133348844 isoform X1 n=2 Tax=Lethenteron reissneri TaxID=7753 RepID=UPI002AB7A664|nr:uncharacterized protein LOC133348844 isoform X1 [Lethenteron reissneri]
MWLCSSAGAVTMKLWTRPVLLLWMIVFVECDWAQEICVKDEVQAVEGDDVTLPCSLPIGKGNVTFKWSQLIGNNLVLIDDSTKMNSPTLRDVEKGNCSHTIFNVSRSHSPMTFQAEITIDWKKHTKIFTLHVAAAPRSHTDTGGGKDTPGGENSPTPWTSSPTLTIVAGVVIFSSICIAIAIAICVKKRRSSGTSLHSPRADGGEAARGDAENIEMLPVTNGVANAHLAVETSPLVRVGLLAKLSSLVTRPIQHRPMRSEGRLQWRCCGKM